MDFTKFVALLSTATLHFSRIDKLGDTFEGSYSNLEVETRRRQNAERISQIAKMAPGFQIDDRSESNFNQWFSRRIAINCWHMNDHESAAMWDLYAKINEGIAVRSSYGRLKQAFNETGEKVYIGCVNYIDYQNDSFRVGGLQPCGVHNLMAPFVHKRRSYEHERELRALIQRDHPERGDDYLRFDAIDEGGANVPVELNTLIEEVRLAPKTPQWQLPLVRDLIARFKFEFAVRQSNLRDEAIF